MSIKGYKAFNKGMICKGKQYEENTTYEENGNKICEAGVMHFCENPFDVLNYYPLIDEDGNISDFADVEAIGDIYKGKDKTATNKLHIGAKLGLKGFIKACVDFTIEKTKVETVKADDVGISSGDFAKIGSGGDHAKITSEGNNSVVMAAGYNSIAKAKIGSWITLAEWIRTYKTDDNSNDIWIPKCVKTKYVDGERIKEDIFYKLVDGEFKEVESED
nr:MAG TPA: hypothetical protein [Bacteriophage sp.]